MAHGVYWVMLNAIRLSKDWALSLTDNNRNPSERAATVYPCVLVSAPLDTNWVVQMWPQNLQYLSFRCLLSIIKCHKEDKCNEHFSSNKCTPLSITYHVAALSASPSISSSVSYCSNYAAISQHIFFSLRIKCHRDIYTVLLCINKTEENRSLLGSWWNVGN